jgi:hypothetical protein
MLRQGTFYDIKREPDQTPKNRISKHQINPNHRAQSVIVAFEILGTWLFSGAGGLGFGDSALVAAVGLKSNIRSASEGQPSNSVEHNTLSCCPIAISICVVHKNQ